MDTFIDRHPADIADYNGEHRWRQSRDGTDLLNAGERPDPPWPKGELIIATALETQPWVIWLSRYHESDS